MIPVGELETWLKAKVVWSKRDLESIEASNRKMFLPDIIARRVCETEILCYGNVLRRIHDTSK